MNENLTFGEFLRLRRKERNLTQSQAAEEMGLLKDSYSYIERGITKQPQIKTFMKIMKFFEISDETIIKILKEFFSDEDD